MTQPEQKAKTPAEELPARLLFETYAADLRTAGIALIVLGVVALITPAVAGTLVSFILGVVLVATGLSKGIRIFRARAFKRHWEDLLLGVLALVAGAVIIARPLVGLTAITLSLVLYFASSGILQIVWWWRLRRDFDALWTLLAGLVTVSLAVFIGIEWPLSGLWAVGTLVGVHLLFGGASLIALASAAGRPEPSGENGDE